MACAAVIGVSGLTVLVEHATPGAIGRLLAWSGLRPSEPSRAGAPAADIAADAEVPAPSTVTQAEPSGMVIDGVLIPESELTFAKGYAKRQAAVIAAQRASAKIVAAVEKAQARLPGRLKQVASLRPVRYGRTHRHVARKRHVAKHVERRVDRSDRVRKRYTPERRPPPRHPDYRARDHRRVRGHDRFALDPRYPARALLTPVFRASRRPRGRAR